MNDVIEFKKAELQGPPPSDVQIYCILILESLNLLFSSGSSSRSIPISFGHSDHGVHVPLIHFNLGGGSR